MAEYTIDKIEYDSNVYKLQDNVSGYITSSALTNYVENLYGTAGSSWITNDDGEGNGKIVKSKNSPEQNLQIYWTLNGDGNNHSLIQFNADHIEAVTGWTPTDNLDFTTKGYVDGLVSAVHEIPSGGTSGQVLTKSSATDYDVVWSDSTGGTQVQVIRW